MESPGNGKCLHATPAPLLEQPLISLSCSAPWLPGLCSGDKRSLCMPREN